MSVDSSTRPGSVTGASGRVYVMIWAVAPADDPGAVERAYHEISSKLVGTPGLLGNSLLYSHTDGSRFIVVSEWTGMAEFTSWERGAEHRDATSPLRPYQDRETRPAIYVESASYGADGPRLDNRTR